MLSDDIRDLDLPLNRHFDRFLQLLDDNLIREAALHYYSQQFGDPDLIIFSRAEVLEDIQATPFRFFMWVSALLVYRPVDLPGNIAEGIEKGLRIALSTFELEYLTVRSDGTWVRELVLGESDKLEINWYSYKLDSTEEVQPIVSPLVYHYLNSSVVNWRAQLYPACLVLGAMALEGCLHEDMSARDRLRRVDYLPYEDATATVIPRMVNDDLELILQVEGTARHPKEYFQQQKRSAAGVFRPVRFTISRRDHYGAGEQQQLQKKRSLMIPMNTPLLDVLSPGTPKSEPMTAEIQGFSGLIKAAESAGRLRSDLLSSVFVETLMRVRNRLAHPKEEYLNQVLPDGSILREFILNRDKVRAALAQVTSYISNEYYELREFEQQKNSTETTLLLRPDSGDPSTLSKDRHPTKEN